MTVDDPLRAALLAALLRDDDDAFDLAADVLAPAPVPPALGQRLRASLAAAPFAPFAILLARLFDVAEDRARAFLAAIPSPDGWDAMAPGIRLMHFSGGPSTAGADVGFVSVGDGLDFPRHTHGGAEHNLILRGTLTDDDGTVYRAGDTFTHAPGSAHTFRADAGLLFAVVVWDVSFDGPA